LKIAILKFLALSPTAIQKIGFKTEQKPLLNRVKLENEKLPSPI
jgi:hypothetical protein